MSIFGEMSGPDRARVFRGAAPFAHVLGHANYGGVAWYLATDLDDWPLGPWDDPLTAGLWLMGAEVVLLAQAHVRPRRVRPNHTRASLSGHSLSATRSYSATGRESNPRTPTARRERSTRRPAE